MRKSASSFRSGQRRFRTLWTSTFVPRGKSSSWVWIVRESYLHISGTWLSHLSNSSVLRQKWQISKQVFQENKARQILRFLEIWRALFLEIPVLRFDLLPYYRRYVRQNQSIFQKWWILFTSPFVINLSSPPFHSLSIFWRYINSVYSTTKFHITYVPILPYYQRIIASKWISTILHELNVLTLVRLFLLS